MSYVALGDSLAAGSLCPPEESYPAQVAEGWRARGWNVRLYNLAVSGYTSQDLLSLELPKVWELSPTIVSLGIGTNDIVHGGSLDAFRGNLQQIFSALRAHHIEAQQVFVLPLPDWSLMGKESWPVVPPGLRDRFRQFNAALAEETRAAGVRLVDLQAIMDQGILDGLLAPDRIHPSGNAYRQWARAILEIYASPSTLGANSSRGRLR